MRIAFLINNAYGIGGTIRTICNLAGQLAAEHDVEIVSVFRDRERPAFALRPAGPAAPPRRPAREQSPASVRDDPRHALRSAVFPSSDRQSRRVQRAHRRADRPLRWPTRTPTCWSAPGPGSTCIWPARRRAASSASPRSTSRSTRTPPGSYWPCAAATRAWTRSPPPPRATRPSTAAGCPACVSPRCPTASRPAGAPPSDGTAPVVVAAGRLAEAKRYDDLIRAFAVVAAARPDWTLRLYGGGVKRAALAALVDRTRPGQARDDDGPGHPDRAGTGQGVADRRHVHAWSPSA